MHNSYAAETSYGTVGQALYYTDLKRWEFIRNPACDYQELRAIGIEYLAIKPRSLSFEGSKANAHKSKQRKLLSLKYPEVIPAIPLLFDITKGDGDSIDRQGTARFGDLLSSGRAVDADNRKTKSSYRLFAVPDGDHGEDLKLYLAHVEYHSWRKDKRSWLAIPHIQNSEPGWWQGQSGPIEQVCFAPGIDQQSTLLAIRSSASIYILKPLYRRSPLAQSEHHAKAALYLESCIDANQLLYVGCDTEPQSVFIHVSFNPWYKRQFVVIDSSGYWTIYEIKGKANSSKGYQALRIERNKLSKFEGRDKYLSLELGDFEWAKVFWIKDVNMIIACSRLGLTVFDMKDRLVSIHDINLRLGANDVILDVQRCIEIDDLIVILTSFIISVVRIDRMIQHSKISDSDFTEIHPKILHSWRHNRDCRDKSLRFCYTIDNECKTITFDCITESRADVDNSADIKIVLYSRSKRLLSLHTFLIPQDDFSVPAAIFDPIELQYSTVMSKKAQKNFILNVLIEPLVRENARQKFSVQMDVPVISNLSVPYYILVILWDDYSVTESVHYLKGKRDNVHVEKPSFVKRGPLSKTRVGPLDDIIMNNEYNRQPAIGIPGNDCQSVPYDQSLSSRSSSRKAVRRASNFGEILHHKPDICDSLNDLTNLIQVFLAEELYMGTKLNWFHHIGDKFRVHDIDEASQALEDAMSRDYRNDRGSEVLTTFQIISPYLKTFAGYDGIMRLSTVYENIVAQWLACVPDDVSSKVRMSKEKLARQIAAELCLASMVLRSDRQTEGAEDQQKTTGTNKIQSSTVQSTSSQANYDERRQISDNTIKHSYQEPRSSTQKRATAELAILDNAIFPAASATSSVMSSSSAYSTRPLHCTALNSYGYSPSSRTLPRALSRCLDTWNLGENPYSFDGDIAIQAVTRPSDVDEDNEYGMSASERRRLQRRAERLLKRQRRQAAKATETTTAADDLVSLQLRPASNLQSSQVTGDVTATPTATATGAGSSQAVPTIPSRFTLSSQVPSSSQNIEKGRSSGMQSAEGTAKKRRRVAGF